MKLSVVLAILIGLAAPAASQGVDAAGSPSELAAVAPSSPEGAAEARAVVESLHGVLLECMKDADELGFQGRFERIEANLAKTFDMPFMARTAVGPTWKELSPEQRTDFIELSRRLSAARYADNFDGYADQTFETRSEEPAARGTIVVNTELVQPEDRNVRFDYRLRKVQGQWRIIDILLDGEVSELVLWRGQYRSLIEEKGFPHLVQAMEDKIEEYSVE
jgi:phospholipid transport system substrate-binding protein